MTANGAAALDGWLTQEEGWSRVRRFKNRKKPSIKANSNDNDKEQRQIYQQTDLQGRTIDARDGNTFGNRMRKKTEDTRGVQSQNTGGLPAATSHYKSQQNLFTTCMSRRTYT